MHATINGEAIEMTEPKTIAVLVEETLGTSEQRGVAVARNGEIVRRHDWFQEVEDGDAIEIVKAVQGG